MCYPTRLCEDFEAAVNLLSGKIKPHVVVQRGEVAANLFMTRLADYCTSKDKRAKIFLEKKDYPGLCIWVMHVDIF